MSGCRQLTEFTLPQISDLKINVSDCPLLKRVVIPEGCTKLSAAISSGSDSIQHVEFPSTLTYIYGTTPFHANRSTFILVCKAVTPPQVDNFGYMFTNPTIYVPDESVNAYKSADKWSDLSSYIRPLSEYAG